MKEVRVKEVRTEKAYTEEVCGGETCTDEVHGADFPVGQAEPEEDGQLPFAQRSREEVEEMLRADSLTWTMFKRLTKGLQDELVGFAMGTRGLKISYDPFFKMVFDPEVHKERLSRMLSCMMGERVVVKRALPNVSSRVTAEGSLLVMDILTELESGELVNVEIQKIGYALPGERAACYSSDLVLRQYSRVKSQKEKRFTYRDLSSVYTIVLIENSGRDFHEMPDRFVHHFHQTSDTGLELNLLQKYIFIALDVFRKISYTIDEELNAWLLFLSSDKPGDIARLIKRYPFFEEIYKEMAEFQMKPGELIGMYSKALEIMDSNTVQYMIEEKDEQLQEKDVQLREKDAQLREKDAEIECGICALVKTCMELGVTREDTLRRVKEGFALDDAKAAAYLETFMKD